jgi:hypothetical protein
MEILNDELFGKWPPDEQISHKIDWQTDALFPGMTKLNYPALIIFQRFVMKHNRIK